MKRIHVAAIAAFVQALSAFADEIAVVTVTKHAGPESQLGSAFSRIDHEEIASTQLIDLKDSLNTTPGVFAFDGGARGGFTELSIRGNRADHTLIRLDGIRVNSGMFPGAAPFLNFAGTGGLGSIEIV